MTGRDALYFEILGGVACQLKNFGGEVFENCGDVDGGYKGGKVSFRGWW